MRFHALGNPFAPLPRVTEGAHHFVVCIVEDGRLQNVVPHRYLIDRDGRIADDGNSVLSDVEIGRYQRLIMQRTPDRGRADRTRCAQEATVARPSPTCRSRPPTDARRHRTARQGGRRVATTGSVRPVARCEPTALLMYALLTSR
jgi:hypothetical protein